VSRRHAGEFADCASPKSIDAEHVVAEVGTKEYEELTMGLFDLFRRKSPGDPPEIRNEKDLKGFFLNATHDERLTELLLQVADKLGRDGVIEVERGGNGKPYATEFRIRPDDSRRVTEIQAESQRLRQLLAEAQSDTERDRLDRELAALVSGFCTVRINVMTSAEFDEQHRLILETWKQLKIIMRAQA